MYSLLVYRKLADSARVAQPANREQAGRALQKELQRLSIDGLSANDYFAASTSGLAISGGLASNSSPWRTAPWRFRH